MMSSGFDAVSRFTLHRSQVRRSASCFPGSGIARPPTMSAGVRLPGLLNGGTVILQSAEGGGMNTSLLACEASRGVPEKEGR